MTEAINDLADILNSMKDCDHKAMAILPHAFPVGIDVQWLHGVHVRRGRVVRVSGKELKVRVRGVGNSLAWIEAERLVDFMADRNG